MKVKLGELTKIRTGKLDANAASDDGTYPFFTCSKEPLRISTYSYDCECVLVAGNGDLNVKYYNGKFDAYQRTYIVESNGDGRLYLTYLYHFMTRYIQELRKLSIGGVIKYIKLGNLTDAEISLPDIKEQKTACKKLEKIKNIIDKKESQLFYLDNLIKARFVEMFRRNNIDVISVGDAVELINGRAFKPTHWMADGLPIIRIQNLNDKTAPFNYFDGIYDKKNYVKKGELLFSWSGTPGTSFGAFIWDREPGILNQHIFRVLPKIDLELNYLRYALNDQLEIIISKAHGGVGLQHITKGELEKVLIPNPNIEQQHSFSNFVAQVDKSKFVLSNELTMCDFYIRLIHDRVMHSCINLRVAQ